MTEKLPFVCLAPALLAALAGCPPPPPPPRQVEPEYDPSAYRPEVSGLRNTDLVTASERLVPYDVERGATVYAIRDLIDVTTRLTSSRERSEAWFLAAAATLDLVIFSDLTADTRPLSGLEDAWGASDRDGIVGAVLERLRSLSGSFVPAVVESAQAVAGSLASADHLAHLDVEALNGVAAGGGPLSFQARVVLLGIQADLWATVRTEGPGPFLAKAAGLSAGLAEPSGESVATLPAGARPAAAMLLFASRNLAAIREAAADEPLAVLLASWLEARAEMLADPQIPLPITADALPDGGRALPQLAEGSAPLARIHLFAGIDRVVVGVTDAFGIADGAVELRPTGFEGAEAPSRSCSVPEPLPEPPRTFACLGALLAAAREVLPPDARAAISVGGVGEMEALLFAAILREVAASGFDRIELMALDGDGALAVHPVKFTDDRALASSPATVRIAAGGFYVGRRGDLVQVPRVSGSYDFGALRRTLAGREPPVAIMPSAATPLRIIVGAVDAAVGSGVSAAPTVVPPQ